MDLIQKKFRKKLGDSANTPATKPANRIPDVRSCMAKSQNSRVLRLACSELSDLPVPEDNDLTASPGGNSFSRARALSLASNSLSGSDHISTTTTTFQTRRVTAVSGNNKLLHLSAMSKGRITIPRKLATIVSPGDSGSETDSSPHLSGRQSMDGPTCTPLQQLIQQFIKFLQVLPVRELETLSTACPVLGGQLQDTPQFLQQMKAKYSVDGRALGLGIGVHPHVHVLEDIVEKDGGRDIPSLLVESCKYGSALCTEFLIACLGTPSPEAVKAAFKCAMRFKHYPLAVILLSHGAELEEVCGQRHKLNSLLEAAVSMRHVRVACDLHTVHGAVFNASASMPSICLRDCNLSEVPPFIGCLVQMLHDLDLSNNHINWLPPFLAHIENVDVSNNPLEALPDGVREAPWVKVQAHLREVATRTAQFNVQKVVLLGDLGDTKPSFLYQLLGLDKKLIRSSDKTTQLYRDVRVTPSLTANVWATGLDLHECIISRCVGCSPATYIIAVDLSLGSRAAIMASKHWIDLLRSSRFFLDSRILIACLRLDSTSMSSSEAERVYLQMKEHWTMCLGSRVGCYLVNLRVGSGVQELRDALGAIPPPHAQLGLSITPNIVYLYDYIARRKEGRMHAKHFLACAIKFGVPEADLPAVKALLTQCGLIISFDTLKLHNMIVIDPMWLIGIIESLINLESQWGSEGIFPQADMVAVFKKYVVADSDAIFALLQELDIIVIARNYNSPVVCVPFLFPVDAPDLSDLWSHTRPNDVAPYARTYRFPIALSGFFSRLMVRLLGMPKVIVPRMWRNGMLIMVEKSQGLIQTYEDGLKLSIRTRERVDSLTNITLKHSSLVGTLVGIVESLITGFYYRVDDTTQRFIPCPHCAERRIEREYMFPIEDVIEAISQGRPMVYCQNISSVTRSVLVSALAPDIAFERFKHLPTSEVVLEEKLGEGGFATVYKGKYKGEAVAVKEPSLGPYQGLGLINVFRDIASEAHIMSSLQHSNLVRMFGVMLQPLRLVMEFVPHGDLWRLLHDPASQHALTYPFRLRLAADIASAMVYLQNHVPPIVHRDLRSPNVFIKSYNPNDPVVAKVADFGLSQMAYGRKVAGILQTWQWLAPEVLNNEEYDGMSDVYSYGIVLWEIMTCLHPFENASQQFRNDMNARTAVVVDHLRPEIPASVPKGLAALITSCWQHNPVQRPTFDEVFNSLAPMLAECDLDVILPFHSPASARGADKSNISSCPTSLKQQHLKRSSVLMPAFHLTSSDQGDHVAVKGGSLVSKSSEGGEQPAMPVEFRLVQSTKVHEPDNPATPTAIALLDVFFCGEVWVGYQSGQMGVFDATTYELIEMWIAAPTAIVNLVVCPIHVLSFCPSGLVQMWRVDSHSLADSVTLNGAVSCAVAGGDGLVWTVTSESEISLLSTEETLKVITSFTLDVGEDGVKLKRVKSAGKRRRKVSAVYTLQYVGGLLWVAANDALMCIDTETFEVPKLLRLKHRQNTPVALFGFNGKLWVGCLSGVVLVFSVQEELKELKCAQYHGTAIGGFTMVNMEQGAELNVRVVSWCSSGMIIIWDPNTLEALTEVQLLTRNKLSPLLVCFSISTNTLLELCADGTIKAWRIVLVSNKPSLSASISLLNIQDPTPPAAVTSPKSHPYCDAPTANSFQLACMSHMVQDVVSQLATRHRGQVEFNKDLLPSAAPLSVDVETMLDEVVSDVTSQFTLALEEVRKRLLQLYTLRPDST